MKNYTIIISIILLLTAIIDFDIPYWYYQLLRWAVCILAVLKAYNIKDYRNTLFIIFCIIAILFNPIAPIYFDRDVWRVVDGITGGLFLFFEFKKWYPQKVSN